MHRPLLFISHRLAGRPPAAAYLLGFLREQPTALYDFLRVCSGKISLGSAYCHWGGLSKARIQQLMKLISPELLLLARQLYGSELVNSVEFEEYEGPTDEQRLRQFIFGAERLARESN